VWELYKWTGDIEYIKRYYPVLKDYNRWLYQNRRLENGLFYWEHPYESGIDNSPRFSSRDESDTADMRNLAAVDLSSYLVRQMRCLAEMAGELGREDDAKKFNKRADEVSALINELLWDTESEMYYDLDTMTGELVMVNSIAGLFPLFAGAAPQDRAESLLRHIMNPDEYNTLIPLPSVARNDPSYETDMWRGPVWVNTAYMVIVGMQDYGFRKEAAELAFKLADGVYRTWKDTGRIYEFYDPDRTGIKHLHRKRGNLYKKLTLGDRPRKNFVGWTGLVNNLLIEHIIGLKNYRGSFRLNPYFPEAASGLKMNLNLPADHLEIRVDVKNPGEIFFEIKSEKGEQEFKMSSGESRDL
jgi:neutral trehalase